MVGDSQPPDTVSRALSKHLSIHGHGFQYAVLRRAEELCDARQSCWVFEVAEFPVVAKGHVGHIDFVLRSRRGRTYLVGECKKADPAKARWVFVRAPYTARNGAGNELVFERVFYDHPARGRAEAQTVRTSSTAHQLGIELRTGEKGEGISGRAAISDAATQVLRGTSGLINHIFRASGPRSEARGFARFLPAIFTTAELWASPVDLREADLLAGSIDTDEITRVPWLWFNYNQSAALAHDLDRSDTSDDISGALRHEYCRTIAVIGASGLEDFLARDLEDWMD